MAEKKRNWLLIILGVIVVVVILGVVAVAGFGYWMYRQMDFSSTTGSNAAQEFADARARFQGQKPYVELTVDGDRESAIVHHELEKASRSSLRDLRLVAYVERENRVVRLRIPFWLVRLGGSNSKIHFNRGGSGWDPGVEINVTPEDIERFGPGLIVDGVSRKGDKFIVWSE